MHNLLKVDLMLEHGLKSKDQKHLDTLVTKDPNTLTKVQRDELVARSIYLTDDALKHFDIKVKKSSSNPVVKKPKKTTKK